MQEKVPGSVPEQNKKEDIAGMKFDDSICPQHYQAPCKSRTQAAKPEHMSGQDIRRVSIPRENNFEISDIIQQVFLEVNEVGTEAAAVGATLVDYFGDFTNFVVDRPFLFFIKHEVTGTLLFWGTIVNPTNDDT
jgi:hypothetical protein